MKKLLTSVLLIGLVALCAFTQEDLQEVGEKAPSWREIAVYAQKNLPIGWPRPPRNEDFWLAHKTEPKVQEYARQYQMRLLVYYPDVMYEYLFTEARYGWMPVEHRIQIMSTIHKGIMNPDSELFWALVNDWGNATWYVADDYDRACWGY